MEPSQIAGGCHFYLDQQLSSTKIQFFQVTLKETTATLWGPSKAKGKLSCFPALSILLLEKMSFICETLQATWIMPPFPPVAPVKSIRVFNGKQSIFNYHFLGWRGLEWKTLISFGKFHRCNLAWGCTCAVDENISCSPRWHETSKEISDNYLYREDINLKLMHTHLINLGGQCSTWWEISMFEFNSCDINPVLAGISVCDVEDNMEMRRWRGSL